MQYNLRVYIGNLYDHHDHIITNKVTHTHKQAKIQMSDISTNAKKIFKIHVLLEKLTTGFINSGLILEPKNSNHIGWANNS